MVPYNNVVGSMEISRVLLNADYHLNRRIILSFGNIKISLFIKTLAYVINFMHGSHLSFAYYEDLLQGGLC